jgi:hypothetical protein
MKENKYFSQVSFWLPFGYVFALGLFFTEDSRFTKVLHRDQTDEWKGKETHIHMQQSPKTFPFIQLFSLFQVSHTLIVGFSISLLTFELYSETTVESV